MQKLFPYVALPVILFVLPIVSFAYNTPALFPTGFWGPIVSCTAPITIQQPQGPQQNGLPLPPTTTPSTNACLSLCDLIATLINLIVFGMSLTLFAGAPVLFAWGGILILISAGDPGKISEGKKILTGTLIGVLITLLAYLLVSTLLTTLNLTGYIPISFNCTVS